MPHNVGMSFIKEIGGTTAVARMVGVKPPTVHGWKTIPSRYCPAIERSTSGAFSCEKLRPDEPWRRIPDKTWPHPKGRPLLDYAKASKPALKSPAPMAEGA
jgi:hypothetical protein